MEVKKPCEFKQFDIYNPKMMFMRKKILEKKLDLEDIKCFVKKDLKENSYIYLYYHNHNAILLYEKDFDEIIKIFNELDNKDDYFSDNIHLEKYNKFLNRDKDFKIKNISDITVLYHHSMSDDKEPPALSEAREIKIVEKSDDLNLVRELKNHHYSPNPKRILNFIPIFPVNLNFFKHDNIYEKEILEDIDNLKLPHYKLYNENKYALLKVLKSQFLNHSLENMNYYLLHDAVPFVNYEHLKNNLTKYYSEEKENYKTVCKKSLNESCLYLLGSDEVIITKEPKCYNIYTKSDEEEENMRKRYISKFDKMAQNNHQIDLENLNNYDIINYSLEGNEAVKKDEKYQHGFYSNGIYKAVQGYEKEKFDKIDKDLIEIEIENNYKNFYNVEIKIGNEILDLNYFYIPKDREFIFKIYLINLWEKGIFLTDFGKAVYKNENVILPKTVKIPEWLSSNNTEDFDKLMTRKL